MNTGKIKLRGLLATITLLAGIGHADNACIEHGPYTNLVGCVQSGTLVSGVLTPTNISATVGQTIVPPSAYGYAVTNGAGQYYVNNDCPNTGPNYYFTNQIAYSFTTYFVPAIPNVFWTSGSYTYTGMVVATGSPCSPLTNSLCTVIVNIGSNNPDVLLDVDFGGRTNSVKVGYAVIGDGVGDYWNGYSKTNQAYSSLANLKTAEGLVSPVGLLVTNLPTLGTNGSGDAMYNDYLKTNSATASITITNLPGGTWNIFLYSQDGNFTLSVGTTSYGTQTCYDGSPSAAPLAWQPGVQYVEFQNVMVTNGQPLTVTINPGINGVAMISGLQIASLNHQPPPQFVAPSGMVSWWRGENNGLDSFGTNNGTLQGGIGFAAGKVGQAFSFNNTNNDVMIPASSSLNVGAGGGFTIEGWINPSDISQTHPIAEWNPGDGTTWGVHFHIISTAAFGTTPGTLYANIISSSANNEFYTAGGVLTSNVFQHVALTYDKTSGQARIYRNGAVVAQQNLGSFTPATTFNLFLGRRPPTLGDTETFAGLLDEMTLYNRALLTNEIAAIYNVGSQGKFISPMQDSDYDGVSDLQELADRTNPNDANSNPHIRLAYFQFDNTNTWVGSAGQLPLLATNVVGVPSWATNAVLIDSPTNTILTYRDVETNGNANINLRSGTIRFWFKPDWSSVSAGGIGPQDQGRLIEMGRTGTNTGWWTFLLDTNGSTLNLITQTNGVGQTNLTTGVVWASNVWHQVVLTYGVSNTAIYLDGQAIATNGFGVHYWPNATERSAGFSVGSDTTGNNQARGAIDELETFNYPLAAADIWANYLAATLLDSDGDGIPNILENQLGLNPHGYNSANGLLSPNALQVFTPLKP